MLCNRLKHVLHDIVTDCQGAFVKDRSIVHNIILSQDLIRFYNRKNVPPRCLIKLDLKKAYDSIHWDFFEGDTGCS